MVYSVGQKQLALIVAADKMVRIESVSMAVVMVACDVGKLEGSQPRAEPEGCRAVQTFRSVALLGCHRFVDEPEAVEEKEGYDACN